MRNEAVRTNLERGGGDGWILVTVSPGDSRAVSLPPHPHRFASFHTCIHEKFMTVSSVSLTLLIHSHTLPPPNATLLAQSIHLEIDFQRGWYREETEERLGSGPESKRLRDGREDSGNKDYLRTEKKVDRHEKERWW